MKRRWEGEEIVTSAPASSSRDVGSSRGYEVFLNFRGPDARLTIADALYHAMIRSGIRAFKDNEELRVGEEIEGGLLQAINDSRIYIPIFSKDYASSKWCLRELVLMMECMRRRWRDNDEKVILPIFYDVDADDVKLKTDLYRKAFQKHESDYGKDLAEQWEKALKEVARFKGRNLKDHGLHELIQVTVEEVSSLLWTRRTDVPHDLVGIKHRKNEIKKLLEQGAFDVRFIVIHGMGGIGKTTLANVVFKDISPEFQGHCCFLRDVRTHDIFYLQKRLLFDILNLRCTCLFDSDEGADMIKTKFCNMKVLIVLDDIDKPNQIMRLAGEPNWFGGGSRIIITTRNIDFLVTEGEDDNVPASHYGNILFYEMPEMDPEDALQLFSERAWGCAKPPPDYISISGELVYALGRLPLALNVIGSTLRGKCRSTWEDVLQKSKKVMNNDVKEKLMISYEALDNCQQHIFLDIACFLINKEKTTAIKYWDAVFGYSTGIDVKILTHMSLIKIIDNDKLWMHDQLRDLGRDINNQTGSRLWDPKEAFNVVQRKKGTRNIVALNLGTPKPDATYKFKRKEFSRFVDLKFLQLDHGNFEGDFKDSFCELRWLSWSNCPSKFQATNFGLENLAVLELSGVNITKDWGGWCHIMVAKQLTVLKLVDCPFLRKTPEFSTISRLERLILKGCALRKIDESIGSLLYLDYLEVECEAIESLPKSIGGLKSLSKLRVQSRKLSVLPHSIGNLVKLKHLILRCKKLRELPDSIGQLESLLELVVPFSRIRNLPHSIGNLKRLKVLKIMASKLEKLPDSIGGLQSLVELTLQRSNIMSLPDCIGNLKKLKKLDVSMTSLSELPKSIGMLENLDLLYAFKCKFLEGGIPSEIGALSSLRILGLSGNGFSRLPTTINQLAKLQRLYLDHCDCIQQLPELPESPTDLHFSLTSLTTIPNLSNLTNLVQLGIEGTPVQEPNVERLLGLRYLCSLTLVVEKMTLTPTALSSLSRLQKLQITCADTRSLPRLPSMLRSLNLTDVQSPIDWSLFSNLENLSMLVLEKYRLREIRFDVLKKLSKFNELHLENCPLIKTLPFPPCVKEIQCLGFDINLQPTWIVCMGDWGDLKSSGDLPPSFHDSIKRLIEAVIHHESMTSECLPLESIPVGDYTTLRFRYETSYRALTIS